MYILMPFKPELAPVKHTLEEVAAMTGYLPKRSDEAPGGGDLIKAIIEGILRADLIIADLTYSNPNVLYELGVANALSKDCLMICQKRAGLWATSQKGEGSPTLPFDLARFVVTDYNNTDDGLKTLKNRLKRKIDESEGVRLDCPVNATIDNILKRNRTTSYLFWGAGAGVLFSFPPSFISALIGASFLFYWQGPGNFWRMVFEGSPPSFFGGGLSLAAYSIVHNYYGYNLKRYSLVLAQVIASFIVGVIMFGAIFLLDLQIFGPEIALGTSGPYLIMYTFAGIGMGLSLNIQSPRASPEAVSTHIAKSTVAFFFTLGLFVCFINLFKNQIFFPSYLEHYRFLDSVSDALRVAIWGISISAFHWWLKWERKL